MSKHIVELVGSLKPLDMLVRTAKEGDVIYDNDYQLDSGVSRGQVTPEQQEKAIDAFLEDNDFVLIMRDNSHAGLTVNRNIKLGGCFDLYIKFKEGFLSNRPIAALGVSYSTFTETVQYYRVIEFATIDEDLARLATKTFSKLMQYDVPYIPTPTKREARIGLLIATRDGIEISTHMLEHRDIKEFYYPKGLVKELTEILKTPKPGLIFLPGKAGSGKTTLIRWLTTELPNKTFVYVPHSQLSMFQSVTQLDMLIGQLKNKVLVLEDAEGLFKSRDGKSTDGLTSFLLNLTDGLLGEILKCKIIVTQNVVHDIDPAFMRKGRLLFSKSVDALPVEQAKLVAADLNKPQEVIDSVKDSMVLSDIFGLEGGVTGHDLTDLSTTEDEEWEEDVDEEEGDDDDSYSVLDTATEVINDKE